MNIKDTQSFSSSSSSSLPSSSSNSTSEQAIHNYNHIQQHDHDGTELYDVIVVGAGLSGAVMADRCARVLNKRVLVIEKRNHIAGNCYDYINEYGHLVNQYGLHIFHTNDVEVYNYITQFSDWIRYDHRVVARVYPQPSSSSSLAEEDTPSSPDIPACLSSILVPVPVCIETVNILCNQHLQNSQEMDAWLQEHQIRYDHTIQNGEEAAKARVGEYLYTLLFEQYTYKQWNKTPAQLDKSILERIPIRNNWDTRYFTDTYQVLPIKGYTHFCQTLLQHPLITVLLSTDFLELRQTKYPPIQPGNYTAIIYTGPIDTYFAHIGLPPLEYRSIHFDIQHVPIIPSSSPSYPQGGGGGGFAQSHVVINEPSLQVPYTRSVEYKHLPMNRHVPSTHSMVVREYTTHVGEPYYPVMNDRNISLYQEYKTYAEQVETEQGVFMLGRLANYKYIDMHVAIRNALDVFESRIIPLFEPPKKRQVLVKGED